MVQDTYVCICAEHTRTELGKLGLGSKIVVTASVEGKEHSALFEAVAPGTT